MNDTQITQFYNKTDPQSTRENPKNESFGFLLADTVAEIANNMNCSNKENCTAIELARMQWGESKVTLDMPQFDKNYTPKALSITNWGIFPTPGAPIQPEFYYYSATFYDYPMKLNQTQCQRILNTNVQ